MPIFDYRCNNCECIFEEDSRNESITCPRCEKDYCTIKYTPTNVIFKCKGFYSTDNKKTS